MRSRSTRLKYISFFHYFFHYDNISTPLFYFFYIKEIKKLFPNSKIIFITVNNFFNILKTEIDLLDFTNIEIICIKNKTEFIPKNIISFGIINLLKFILIFIRLVIFKLKFKTEKIKNVDILYLSTNYKFWTKNKNNILFDYYYEGSFHKINTQSKLNPICLATGITFNNKLSKFSIYSHVSLINLIGLFFQSIIMFLNMLPVIKKIWILNPVEKYFLSNKIFFMNLLNKLFTRMKPKAVIAYMEAYLLGRIIASVTNNLNIDFYGFQHAFYTYFHPAYKALKLYKNLPEIFPNYFFIFGDNSEKLFRSYGYPKQKMLKIGFDRSDLLTKKDSYKKSDKKSDKKRILFVGGEKEDIEIFQELYDKIEKFKINQLLYRPHPGYPFDYNKFLIQFPKAKLINSKEYNLNENIDQVDCVISRGSTALINAIIKKKVVILYLPDEWVDLYDLKYWGAQKVKKLEKINWEKKSNPKNLLKEIIPQVEIHKFLEKKYKSKIR